MTSKSASALRLAVAGGQVLLWLALTWWYSQDTSVPASATRVDWEFVLTVAATPLALAASGWIGWRARRYTGRTGPAPIRVIALFVEAVTLSLLGISLLMAPVVILGAIAFGPMG